MDDILKKFKALTFKEQLGIYAGIALLIGGFLPFAGFDFGFAGLGSYDWSWTDWGIGWLGWLGGIAGAVFIFLKQPFNASIGFAVAALAAAWALIDTLTSDGAGLKFGAFIVIAGAAVGLWATIDELIAKMKK